MGPGKLVIILNPAAGGGVGARRFSCYAGLLSRAGCVFEVLETRQPGDARRMARDLANQTEPLLIVAAGGDGTVNEVASGILDHDRPTSVLGVLPLGTGNDFARLQGAFSPEQAVAILAQRQVHRVDAIRFRSQIEGRTCVSFALLFVAAGFVGDLLRATTPAVKRTFGRHLSYPVGFLRAWISCAAKSMRLTHDSGAHAGECLLVCACNAEFAGGHSFRPAPGAVMDDGQLELLIVRSLGRWQILPQFLRVMRGTHERHPSVICVKTTKMTLESAVGTGVQADGDHFGEPPLDLEVRHKALTVLWGGEDSARP